MAKKSDQKSVRKLSWWKILLPILIVFVLLATAAVSFQIYFLDRIYPAISINNVDIGGLTTNEAREKVLATLRQRQTQDLTFRHQNTNYQIDLTNEPVSFDLDSTLNQAFDYGHRKFYLTPIKFYLNPQLTPAFENQLTTIRKDIDQNPVEAQLLFEEDIRVTPSQPGLVLDTDQLKNTITAYLNTGQLNSQELPMRTAYPKLSYNAALSIKQLLDKTKTEPIQLSYDGRVWTIDTNTLIGLLDLQNSQSQLASTADFPIAIDSIVVGDTDIRDSKLALDDQKMTNYFADIAEQINRPVQEPLFQFDGTRVTEFQPPTAGLQVDIERNKARLLQNLSTGNPQKMTLIVDVTQPKNKLTNELGIKELVGRGVSNFAHSIPNRIYNLTLASSRVNGILIPPGETFSFVKTVGDISAASGYKQGYIIKEGRTVLDDGGGVCQVSTTLFRAALNAGLPIVKRTAHAYRVEYYEQGFPPGLDATIFAPTVDFQFKNDTPANILIQTSVQGTTLTVDFYGTSDGRIATISKPTILSTTPPLPEIRQDDPTLPKGTVKQVDWPASGANVIFTRTVTRNGENLINETFRSNYRPWQAVFLVGTKEG